MNDDVVDDLINDLPRYHDPERTLYVLALIGLAVLFAMGDAWELTAICLLGVSVFAVAMYAREQRWRAGSPWGDSGE